MPARQMVEDWVADGVVPGLALAVWQDGGIVAEWYGGKQAAGAGVPVSAETLYPVASLTKPVTATVVMSLVDEGRIGLDEEMRRFVGGFSAPEKRGITVRQLLCHTAGLPKDDPAELDLWEQEAAFDQFVQSAARLPLISPPGTEVIYSNAGYWLLGEIVRKVSGVSFPEAATGLLERLGPDQLSLQPPPDEYPRLARRYGRPKIANTSYGRSLGSPSGGLFASARGIAALAGAFLADGESVLRDFVSRSAREEMLRIQTGDLPGGIPEMIGWDRCTWGLGWEVRDTKRPHWSGDLTSPRTFSHIGQSGAMVWGDPDAGMALALLANRDMATDWWRKPARWARFSNAVIAGLS